MTEAHVQRVCIQWPRFGPYHLARLAAVHRLLQEEGVELVALETAGQDATYAWRIEDGGTAFRREQVFPGATFNELTPQIIHKGITEALDRLRPDAVAINSYSLPDARACLAWCLRHRRVAVCMTDSKADDAPRTRWRERAKALLVQAFDAALLAGTPQRAYFTDLGFPPTYIRLGYDVVDNTYFAERAAQARRHPETTAHLPGLGDRSPFFLASNRFIPRKNLPVLLDAYRQYRTATAKPWRLVLLGDGPERPRIEAMLEEQRIEGVTLAGFRQIEELPAYYGRAGAFVHPALTDQWGLVVNEAMAAGLPVLVSRAVGCAYDLVAKGGNGFIFDPAAPAQLADLLGRMASLSEADRSAMGRRSVEIIAEWTPERFAEGLWAAVQMGRGRSGRRRTKARLMLGVLRRAARSVDSFFVTEY